MEWGAFLNGLPVSLAIPALMGWELIRRLDRGELVFGREHQRVLKAMDELTEDAERIAREQREAQKEERSALLSALEASRQTNDVLIARLEEKMP